MKELLIKRKKINFQGFKEIKKSYTEGFIMILIKIKN